MFTVDLLIKYTIIPSKKIKYTIMFKIRNLIKEISIEYSHISFVYNTKSSILKIYSPNNIKKYIYL